MILWFVYIAVVALVYYFSRNLVLTILSIVIVALLNRSLGPYFVALWEKWFPKPQIQSFRASNMNEESDGKGMRVLLVSPTLDLKSASPSDVSRYDALFAQAVTELKAASPIFDVRYDSVVSRNLPAEYCVSLCSSDGKNVRKCFRQWLLHIKSKQFGVWNENSELFMHDCQYQQEADGAQLDGLWIVLFARSLPKARSDQSVAPSASV